MSQCRHVVLWPAKAIVFFVRLSSEFRLKTETVVSRIFVPSSGVDSSRKTTASVSSVRVKSSVKPRVVAATAKLRRRIKVYNTSRVLGIINSCKLTGTVRVHDHLETYFIAVTARVPNDVPFVERTFYYSLQ